MEIVTYTTVEEWRSSLRKDGRPLCVVVSFGTLREPESPPTTLVLGLPSMSIADAAEVAAGQAVQRAREFITNVRTVVYDAQGGSYGPFPVEMMIRAEAKYLRGGSN